MGEDLVINLDFINLTGNLMEAPNKTQFFKKKLI